MTSTRFFALAGALVTLACTLPHPARAAVSRHQIEAVNAISMQNETPHTKWARPYARGPIRVLYLGALNANVNVGSTRAAVELQQRFDCAIDAVLVMPAKGTSYSITYEGESGVYGGDIGEQRLARLLETPYDAYILPHTDTAGHLPSESLAAVIAHVRDGAGLLLAQKDAYQTIDKHISFGGERLSDLPHALTGLSARAYTLGRGRIVELAEEGIVITNLPIRERIFGVDVRRDAYFSAYGRAMLWAAGREPRIRLDVDLGESEVAREALGRRMIKIRTAGDEAASSFTREVRVRTDGRGGQLLARDVLSPGGATPANVSLPPLPAGRYHVEVRLSSDEGAEAWSVQPLEVTSDDRLSDLHLQREWGEAGDPIIGRVNVHARDRDRRILDVRVIDRHGRILARKAVPEPGDTVDFRLPTDDSMPGFVAVEAALAGPDGPVTHAYEVYTINKRRRGDFNFVMWGRLYATPILDIAEDFIARCGVTARLETSHVPWNYMTRAGMTYVPYCSSGLKRQHWNRQGRASSIPLQDNGEMDSGCWNAEPAVTDRLRNWLGDERDFRRHGVLAYSMGDEVETYASCLHPSCMEAYQLHLERRYRSIEALNDSWGTDFDDFSAVELSDPKDNEEKQAFAVGNYARWFDRKAFQYANMADYITRFRRAAETIDPRAWAGPEGTGWLDDDLDGIVRAADWWILYSIPATEVVRSIAPKGFPYGVFIGYSGSQTYYPLSDFWLGFLRGANCNGWWRIDNFLGPHFGPSEGSREMVRTARVVFDGLGRLLNVESEMQHDGIVMLHSFASSQAASHIPPGRSYGTYSGWMTNSESEAAAGLDWALKPGGKNHLVWHRAIRSVGLQFEYVTDRMMHRDEFAADDYRVMILSQCEALGEREAEVIRRFARRGGTVIADVRPGLYDDHCHRRAGGILDDLFGVRHTDNVEAVEIDGRIDGKVGGATVRASLAALHVNPAVEVTTGKALGAAGNTPIMIVNDVGPGRAILMNFTIATLPNLSRPDTDESAAELVSAMFAEAGVRWPLRLKDETGNRARNVEAVRWETGDGIEVVAVYGPLDDGRAQWRPREGLMERLRAVDVPRPVVLQLPERRHVSVIGADDGLGRKRTVTVSTQPWRPTFVVLSDKKLRQPELTTTASTVTRGQTLTFGCRVPKAGGMHAMKVRVTTPDGTPADWFSQSVIVPPRGGVIDLPIAHNEAQGAWTIEVTDLYTGRSVARRFVVR